MVGRIEPGPFEDDPDRRKYLYQGLFRALRASGEWLIFETLLLLELDTAILATININRHAKPQFRTNKLVRKVIIVPPKWDCKSCESVSNKFLTQGTSLTRLNSIKAVDQIGFAQSRSWRGTFGGLRRRGPGTGRTWSEGRGRRVRGLGSGCFCQARFGGIEPFLWNCLFIQFKQFPPVF